MSPSLHQHARRRLDAVVREGFDALKFYPDARVAYSRVLSVARARSELLRPSPRGDQDVAAVRALVRIARYRASWKSSPCLWRNTGRGLYGSLGSLTSHLFGSYPAPPILVPVWLLPDDGVRPAMLRWWFIQHVRGLPFRKVSGLSIPMTRKMEHLFLASPPHLSVIEAVRRAEVLGLGGSDALAEAVLATRLGRTLADGVFWRPVVHWLVNHWDELMPEHVEEIVDGIHEVALSQTLIRVPGDEIVEPPRCPDFSVKGRTPTSLLRELERLRRLPIVTPHGPQWPASSVAGMTWREAGDRPLTWDIVELRNARALRIEGATLRHCVAEYASACWRGKSRIWSLRCRAGEADSHPRYTDRARPQGPCTGADPRLRQSSARPASDADHPGLGLAAGASDRPPRRRMTQSSVRSGSV